jgi:hypothetical protein
MQPPYKLKADALVDQPQQMVRDENQRSRQREQHQPPGSSEPGSGFIRQDQLNLEFYSVAL